MRAVVVWQRARTFRTASRCRTLRFASAPPSALISPSTVSATASGKPSSVARRRQRVRSGPASKCVGRSEPVVDGRRPRHRIRRTFSKEMRDRHARHRPQLVTFEPEAHAHSVVVDGSLSGSSLFVEPAGFVEHRPAYGAARPEQQRHGARCGRQIVQPLRTEIEAAGSTCRTSTGLVRPCRRRPG